MSCTPSILRNVVAERSEAERGLVIVTYARSALQSRPRERQMYVTVLAPGGPPAILAHVIFICYWAWVNT